MVKKLILGAFSITFIIVFDKYLNKNLMIVEKFLVFCCSILNFIINLRLVLVV